MNHGMINLYYLIILILLLTACSDPPAPALLYEDRQVVDSLYQLEYEKIIGSLDTACQKMLEEQIEPTVDSILKIRLVEIVRQKQRYQRLKAKENEVQ